MAGLQDFRQQHPEYDDMDDRTLADALHAKFYSDIPKVEFDAKMGLASASSPQPKPQASAKPARGVVSDVARSIPTGLAEGAAAIAGAPGDVVAMAGKPTVLDGRYTVAGGVPLPTGKGIVDALLAPFGGRYQPETTAGEYARTIASFAPAAAAPGSMVARGARVVVPAVASETAGQLTKGTAAEPYARAIAALAGGFGVGGVEGYMAARRPTPGVPTVADLRNSATQAYSQADQAGLVVRNDSFRNMTANLATQLADEGLDPTLHPRATAALKRLQTAEGDLSLQNIDTLRRVAASAAGSLDKDERRIGRIIKDTIDDFVGGLQAQDVVSGDAPAASAAITQARDFWSRASKGEIIENAIDKAKTRAGQFSVSGQENGLRTEFRKIAMSDRAMRRFSAEEQAAIRQVAEGTTGGNALRLLGKLAIRGPVSSIPAMGAYSVLGPGGAAVAAGLGEVGRFGASASTARSARQASELVRMGPRSVSSVTGPVPAGDQGAIPYAAILATLAAQNGSGQ